MVLAQVCLRAAGKEVESLSANSNCPAAHSRPRSGVNSKSLPTQNQPAVSCYAAADLAGRACCFCLLHALEAPAFGLAVPLCCADVPRHMNRVRRLRGCYSYASTNSPSPSSPSIATTGSSKQALSIEWRKVVHFLGPCQDLRLVVMQAASREASCLPIMIIYIQLHGQAQNTSMQRQQAQGRS